MKGFFAAIIVLTAFAFAFTALPSDFAKLISGLAAPAKERMLNVLREKSASRKSPAEARSELIDRIEDSLRLIENEFGDASASNAAAEGTFDVRTFDSAAADDEEKAGTDSGDEKLENAEGRNKKSVRELISETEGMLEELRAGNADDGFFKNTAEKIVSNILSSQSKNQCVAEEQEK